MAGALQAQMPGGMGAGGMSGRHHGGGQENQNAPHIASPNDESLREILSYKKELNLSDTQIEAIRGIRSDLITEDKTKVEAMIASQKDLSEIMNQPDPDFSKAHEKIKELSEQLVVIQTLPINALEKAFKVLSTEQKNKLFLLRNPKNKDNADQTKPAENEPQAK